MGKTAASAFWEVVLIGAGTAFVCPVRCIDVFTLSINGEVLSSSTGTFISKCLVSVFFLIGESVTAVSNGVTEGVPSTQVCTGETGVDVSSSFLETSSCPTGDVEAENDPNAPMTTFSTLTSSKETVVHAVISVGCTSATSFISNKTVLLFLSSHLTSDIFIWKIMGELFLCVAGIAFSVSILNKLSTSFQSSSSENDEETVSRVTSSSVFSETSEHSSCCFVFEK